MAGQQLPCHFPLYPDWYLVLKANISRQALRVYPVPVGVRRTLLVLVGVHRAMLGLAPCWRGNLTCGKRRHVGFWFLPGANIG